MMPIPVIFDRSLWGSRRRPRARRCRASARAPCRPRCPSSTGSYSYVTALVRALRRNTIRFRAQRPIVIMLTCAKPSLFRPHGSASHHANVARVTSRAARPALILLFLRCVSKPLLNLLPGRRHVVGILVTHLFAHTRGDYVHITVCARGMYKHVPAYHLYMS